ncbi:DUF305 domain-containing protein [Kineococcus arenarius]|uniref:DUF305 domain-containing protein n=1 Tax=Kineococcus sp. SYSU DK007 TaxID=3383128 RepID=UPI003D7C51E3
MDHSAMGASSAEASPSSTASTPASATTGSSTAVEAEHNDQDVMFAQMMLVHHQGAIEMAQMATTQASDQEVKTLAAAIEATQQPEIEQMTSWLQTWGEPVEAGSSVSGDTSGDMSGGMDGMDGMDHSMAGMMSEEQMTQLHNATGADFDRMFLQLMIEHHAGAVRMAEIEQQYGLNTQALELADSIVISQNAEIDQMKQMLAAMG